MIKQTYEILIKIRCEFYVTLSVLHCISKSDASFVSFLCELHNGKITNLLIKCQFRQKNVREINAITTVKKLKS